MLWQTIAHGVHIVHMPVLETELRLQLCGHDGLGFLRCLSLAGRPLASCWDAAREAGTVSGKYTEKRGPTFTLECLMQGCLLLPAFSSMFKSLLCASQMPQSRLGDNCRGPRLLPRSSVPVQCRSPTQRLHGCIVCSCRPLLPLGGHDIADQSFFV
jgi:hypothetical protein